jgi:hypothetical protein
MFFFYFTAFAEWSEESSSRRRGADKGMEL